MYGSRLTATLPAGVPGRAGAIAHQSVGAAYAAAGKIASHGHPVLGEALRHASTGAFLHGLTIGSLVAGSVAAAGAVLAAAFLPAQPAPPAQPAAQPAPPAQPARVRAGGTRGPGRAQTGPPAAR